MSRYFDSPRTTIRFAPSFGEHSGTSKLTNDIVLALRRERPENLRSWLAARGVEVSVQTARRAMRRHTWKHLPPSEALV